MFKCQAFPLHTKRVGVWITTLLHGDQFRMNFHSPTSRLHRRDASRNNNSSCVPRWPGFYLLPFFLTYLSVRRGQMGLRLRMQLDSFLSCISATLAGLSCFRHSLKAKAAMMSENLAIVSPSKFQQRLSLNSNYCTRWWGFKCAVTLSLLLHRASCRFIKYHTTNKCTNCMSFILNHFFKTLFTAPYIFR